MGFCAALFIQRPKRDIARSLYPYGVLAACRFRMLAASALTRNRILLLLLGPVLHRVACSARFPIRPRVQRLFASTNFDFFFAHKPSSSRARPPTYLTADGIGGPHELKGAQGIHSQRSRISDRLPRAGYTIVYRGLNLTQAASRLIDGLRLQASFPPPPIRVGRHYRPLPGSTSGRGLSSDVESTLALGQPACCQT